MPRTISFKQFIHEMAFLAPELLDDESFMDEWCHKYFGVKYDQPLTPLVNHEVV